MKIKKITTAVFLLGCLGIAAFVWASRIDLIPSKGYSDGDFQIATYHSPNDQDGDGIDDQTDLLKGVKDYIATKPKYKSKYYATGYPDDGYGVCSDVVAFGLLGAGYDLQALVDGDVKENPGLYDIDIPDANIDFRRVRNLQVYFDHNAITLTTDLGMIDQFQGGDIVIFKNHIGIVSDLRNKDGVPFLIHHAGVFQLRYQENAMEKQGPILGHYRIS